MKAIHTALKPALGVLCRTTDCDHFADVGKMVYPLNMRSAKPAIERAHGIRGKK